MSKVIVYQPSGGGVVILIPSGEIPLEEVARKDVPAGRPYKIVEVSTIPTDRTFRDAWEADLGKPDGYGIGPEAWFAEQASE